ncbi:radical SAM family heme chaperone HemW [Gudongella sp. SC589]|uniref:radical SAM family heme chaperone HemW n=1 Tax=Gudongella sp. SC589 TaxID=3385990 RepID=UPI0039048E7C
MEKAGLYIHIPFCERKCHYCDFTSVPGNNDLMDRYVERLIKEISMASDTYEDINIGTIFIGGGTPSILHENKIADIMDAVRRDFSLDTHAEVTIEINPGTLTVDKAISYRASGINRASVGIQSMNNGILKTIGRIHSEEQVLTTVENLRRAGFENINGDIMFGLPHQSIEDFLQTLDKVISLELEHISMYGLILEENTPLYRWYNRGLVCMPDEDEERVMYHTAIDSLEFGGYRQYEISNFAKEGFECRHNLGYWKLRPYIGVGLSSHSSISGRRYWNSSNFSDYFNKLDRGILPIAGDETISRDLMEAEYMILGIRLNEGISIEDYEKRFNTSFMGKYGEVINNHTKSGLIQLDDGTIRLTRKGMDLSNQVEIDFLP